MAALAEEVTILGGFEIMSVFPYGGSDAGGWSMDIYGYGFSSGATITVDGNSYVSVDDANGYDFGLVDVSAGTQDVTITFANMGDTGEQAAEGITGTDSAMWSFKGGTAPGTGGDCPISVATLNQNEMCTVVLTFDPSSTGAKTATLGYFGLSISLSGEGI